MSFRACSIEDTLKAAGYKTERIGGEVNAHDPVYGSFPGSSERVVMSWKLVEIRSDLEASAFISARS